MASNFKISRRALIRSSVAGALGIVGTSLLAACSSGDSKSTPAAAQSTSGSASNSNSSGATASASTSNGSTATSGTAQASASPGAANGGLGASLIGEIEGPEIITDESKWPKSFNEAPQLADLVKQGKLPPVAERIGQDPIVVKPLHEIGKYGGTWHRGFTGPGDGWNGFRAAGMDTIIGWAPNGKDHVPNIAKAWEMSDDGTTLTLTLRRGMKWSDGEPFTADDFVFWYEDMFSNDDFMPVKTNDMKIGGQVGSVEKVDDTTVKFVFPSAYFLLVDVIAGANGLGGQAVQGLAGNGGYAPAHYLKQFHPKYADEAKLKDEISKAGVNDWPTLLKQKNNWTLNPDLPVLTPWKTSKPINTSNWVLERNPYSVWVDTEGNQLPYIDTISMTLVESLEVENLSAIAGQYDFQARGIDLGKLPVILENREKSDYTVHLDLGDYGSDICFYVNQSYEDDAEVGKWLGTADFRRALSLGIQRDQINETFFLGTGTGGSAVPSDSNKYNPGPEYRTRWATYDPDQANQLLDKLGLTKKNGDGFRLRSDGSGPLSVEVMTNSGQFLPFTQMAEMIAEHWKAIGIKLTIKEVERSLGDQMVEANQVQLFAWSNDGSENLFLSPKGIIPRGSGDSMGPLYGQWYSTGGKQGKEPPEDLKAAMEKFDKALVAPDEERIKMGKELWANSADQVYLIGIVGLSAASMGIRIVKNNVGNVPARQYNSPIVKNPCISIPPTFYFKS
ncbi:MAG TPA: ABC transporter substrate-binding protein [Nitrolancea sp.]|nr:ABC transporter substrate-binding protein [Nitrolancea sp.]